MKVSANYLKWLNEENLIIATFLPCAPLASWDDDSYPYVAFIDTNSDNFNFSYDFNKQKYPDEIGEEFPKWYDYCYLTVPQEELGTITVTFKEEPDGRLIATSCRSNRK